MVPARRAADIVVVGDGVAASAALLTLGEAAPTLDVLVVTGVGGRRRPGLGEHLSAPGVAVLEELGLGARFRGEGHLETHAAYSAWGGSMLRQRNALGDPHAAGWCLDRERFDAWLRHRARERCHYRRLEATVERARPIDGEVELWLRGGERLRAGFVLDASGRTAAVARHLAHRRRLDRLIAVYDVFAQLDPGIEPTAGPLVEAMPAGWLYSALRPDRRLVVIWFTDGDLLRGSRAEGPARPKRALAFREQVLASVYTRRRIETAGFAVDQPLLAVPGAADASTRLSDPIIGPGWAAVGDAAAAFDPLSSHGLTAALWSGRRGALGAARHASGDDRAHAAYGCTTARGVDAYCAQRRTMYRSEWRFDGPFWRRRKRASEGVLPHQFAQASKNSSRSLPRKSCSASR